MQTQIPAQQTKQGQSQTEHKTTQFQQPQFADSRPEFAAQLRSQSLMANSPRVAQPKSMQAMMGMGMPVNADNQSTVQRVININGEQITHASRRAGVLFHEVVVPWLETNGYKTYGIKAQLVRYIKEQNANFIGADQFINTFIPWLQQQTRVVKGGKVTPVLKKFTVTGMSRPAWSSELKTKLGFAGGDNVRHVIRNATLKRALQLEFENYTDSDQRKRRMIEIGNRIGAATDGETIDVITKKVYETVYLNEANLFSGAGPYNQIIGFSADKVQALGQSLIDSEDLVNPAQIFNATFEIVVEASKSAGITVPNPVTNDLHSILQHIGEVYNQYDFVEPDEIGDLIMDIGINFGFDLIDGRVDSDQTNIAERQSRLIACEVALQQFLNSNGVEGDLANIFYDFVTISR